MDSVLLKIATISWEAMLEKQPSSLIRLLSSIQHIDLAKQIKGKL